MAIFGFGKKKNDEKKTEDQAAPSGAANPAKSSVSAAIRRPQPKASGAAGSAAGSSISARLRQPGAPGTVKRPSIAVQPKKPDAAAIKPGAPAADTDASVRKIRKSTDNKQLGQLLIKDGKINQQHLTKALATQQQNGGLLGQILTKMEACSKGDVAGALKKQRTITTVNLAGIDFDRDALALLKREFCEKNRLIPFEITGTQLCVAMSNALDTSAKNEIKELTQMHIKIFDASHDDIQTAIKTYMSGDAITPQVSLAEAAQKELEPDPTQIVIELPEEAFTIDEEASAFAADNSIEALPEIPSVELNAEEIAAASIIPIVEETSARPEPKPAAAQLQPVTQQPLPAAPPPATVHVSLPTHELTGGDIPSIPSINEIENIDESALFSHHAPQQIYTGQSLTALPIKPALARKIVRDGKMDRLRLWEAEHSGELAVPALLQF